MTHAETRVRPQTTPGLRGLLDPARPSHKWYLAATVSLSGFLVGMSQMAVQVALPQIMTGFGLDLDHAQWVITAYTIAGALVVPAVGWLGQRLGNRRLYFLSLLVFLTTSTLCAFAWSGPALIALRLLQGLGGGSIAPMTMTFLSGVFPPDQRGRAMGFFGMGQTAGPILGTALGGYLTEYLSWRMVFLINTVPGVLCLAMVLLVLPNLRDEGKPTFDGLGLLSLATMLVSLLVALSQGHREGWDAPFIQRLFVVAVVAFVAFLVRELSSAAPLIDLRLYTNRTFAAVSGLMLLFFMAFTGSTFLQVILVQRLLDYTPAQAGFVLLPGSLALALSFPLAGRVADKCDRRLLMLVALSIITLASYLFTFVSLERPLSWIIGLVLLRYSSGSFVYAPLMASALAHLPADKVRMGSGLLNLMQNGLGNTLGLALMTTVLQHRLAYHSSLLDQQQTLSVLGWRETLGPVRELVQQSGATGALGEMQVLALVQRHLEQQAAVAAYQDCFLLVTLLCLASMPLVLLIWKPRT